MEPFFLAMVGSKVRNTEEKRVGVAVSPISEKLKINLTDDWFADEATVEAVK